LGNIIIMELSLENRKILIYGATGGIGKAICKELKKQNAELFLIGRSKQKLTPLADELEIPDRHSFQIDALNSEESLQKIFQWLGPFKGEGFFAGFHCVGAGHNQRAKEISYEKWEQIVNLNLNSAFLFYKLLWSIRYIKRTELVYFGSASTDNAWPKNSLYGASKAGLEYFAKALQNEVQTDNGRVWLYRPGAVRTQFFDQIKNHLPKEKMIHPQQLAKIVVSNLIIDHDIHFPEIELLSGSNSF